MENKICAGKNQLKQLRLSCSLSQKEFARLLHKSPGHICRVESGKAKPGPDLIRAAEEIAESYQPEDYKMIGLRIKSARESKRLTQSELAEKIGMSRNTIVNIEHGKTKVSEQVIKEIARVLDVSEDWIRTGEEPLDFLFQLLRDDPKVRKRIKMYIEELEKEDQ